MSLAQFAVDRMAARRLRAMVHASENPVETQARVLRDLLRAGARTKWGREHGYADLRSGDDYRSRVPTSTYEEMKPWWERNFTGERDVTWPGHVKYFALSSGTTSGNKLLPVSRENLRSNRTSGLSVLALFLDLTGDTSFMSGKSLYLAGSAPLREEGHSRVGDASGIMLKFTPKLAQRYRLPDPAIASLGNWTEKMRRIVETSIDHDVRMVSACPSWGVLLFEELVAEAMRRMGVQIENVAEIWPRFRGCVHFGMAWQPYRKAFDRLLGPDALHMDTWSASEGGMFSITDRRDHDDMLLVLDNGIYFEFIPFDQIEDERPDRVGIESVREGEVYEVVLTTNSGIWAYRLGDLVRFTSTDPHRILMVGRSKMNLNAFGEHVIIEEMERAVGDACRDLGAEAGEFTVAPVFPEAKDEKPYHRWLIEFRQAPNDLGRFGEVLDRSIRENNEDYDTHRTDDYGMAPPRIEVLGAGTFYRWMERRGKLGGQHKIPRVLREPSMSDELLELSASGAD